jgi:hypothetical protein
VSEACFSGPALLLLTPIVAGIVTGFGLLWRDGIKSRDAHILYLSGQLTLAHNRLQRGIPVMDAAETELRSHSGRKR